MYMSQLADKQIDSAVEITAGRFMAGKFPFVMIGLPATALAMYVDASHMQNHGGGLTAIGVVIGLHIAAMYCHHLAQGHW